METDRKVPAIDLEISDTQSHLVVPRLALTNLVRRVLELEGVVRGSISIALVDDATIRTINARHLGHDWPTDVISFLFSDPDDLEISGELVVSTEMARATAIDVGADPWLELSLYVVHGLLHLRGFDDQAPEDALEMRKREGEVLQLAGLSNTYPLVPSQAEVQPWPL